MSGQGREAVKFSRQEKGPCVQPRCVGEVEILDQQGESYGGHHAVTARRLVFPLAELDLNGTTYAIPLIKIRNKPNFSLRDRFNCHTMGRGSRNINRSEPTFIDP